MKASTDVRAVRSSAMQGTFAEGISSRIRVIAFSPYSVRRQAITTSAPYATAQVQIGSPAHVAAGNDCPFPGEIGNIGKLSLLCACHSCISIVSYFLYVCTDRTRPKRCSQGGTNLSETNLSVTEGDNRQNCTRILGAVLDRIADKWTILVVGALSDGPKRFSELVHEIEGVSHRMLTLTLRNLEKDGLITQTVTPTRPPRVDYGLTPMGQTLIEPFSALFKWAREHLQEMEAFRRAHSEHGEPDPTL